MDDPLSIGHINRARWDIEEDFSVKLTDFMHHYHAYLALTDIEVRVTENYKQHGYDPVQDAALSYSVTVKVEMK